MKIVTKYVVMTAINYEPLRSGRFIQPRSKVAKINKVSAAKKNCYVCAVGGVIRSIFRRKTIKQIEALSDINVWDELPYGTRSPLSNANTFLYSDEMVALVLKNPWNALSVAFETVCDRYSLQDEDDVILAVRADLVEWVDKMFPMSVKILEKEGET